MDPGPRALALGDHGGRPPQTQSPCFSLQACDPCPQRGLKGLIWGEREHSEPPRGGLHPWRGAPAWAGGAGPPALQPPSWALPWLPKLSTPGRGALSVCLRAGVPLGCCRLGCPSCPSTKHTHTQTGVRVREDPGAPPQEAELQGLPHSRGPSPPGPRASQSLSSDAGGPPVGIGPVWGLRAPPWPRDFQAACPGGAHLCLLPCPPTLRSPVPDTLPLGPGPHGATCRVVPRDGSPSRRAPPGMLAHRGARPVQSAAPSLRTRMQRGGEPSPSCLLEETLWEQNPPRTQFQARWEGGAGRGRRGRRG